MALLLSGCVVEMPRNGRLQMVCDRSIVDRPAHLRCDHRYPIAVTWKFK